jgi:hypothetical protein
MFFGMRGFAIVIVVVAALSIANASGERQHGFDRPLPTRAACPVGRAARGGMIDVLINSGELYRSLGGYPSSVHGMPRCCDAMQDEIKPGDTLLVDRMGPA